MESTLSKQAARQAARRTAAAAQARLMQERLERDKKGAALGVQVLTALRERDRLVAQADLVAGQALQALTSGASIICPSSCTTPPDAAAAVTRSAHAGPQ